MEYKEMIIEMVKKIKETDEKFLRQIYLIIRKHVGRNDS